MTVIDGAPTILRASDVSKTFGELRAVSGVSFSVAKGEVLGMAGPNGAGKSTLFNLLTGIPFGPDSGDVFLNDVRISTWSARRICHAGLARTFQTEAVFSTLTVAENIRVSATYAHKGRPRKPSEERIDELLQLVSITGQRDRLASELSLFDKKRLMIANCLAGDPELLLLDEPASGLNPDDQVGLIDLIRTLNAAGITIVVIEHVLSVLRAVADRILVLSGGEVLIDGEPEAVLTAPEVIEAYLGSKAARE